MIVPSMSNLAICSIRHYRDHLNCALGKTMAIASEVMGYLMEGE